jgi:hypothetical protein
MLEEGGREWNVEGTKFVDLNTFSNIAYENDTLITQFSEENRRLHH